MLYNSKTERLLLEKKIVFNSIHRHQLPIDFDKKKIPCTLIIHN
jgi:hypothetical protein